MNDLLNEKLIQAMREQLPEETNLASTLMDILSLGKESAYRRLRGDVMFTFEDVAKISRKLGISLDKIVGESKVLDNNKWAFIDIGSFFSSYSSDYIEQYTKKLNAFAEILQNSQNQSKPIIRCATCHIPYYFIIPYKKLSLFKHYKKAYLVNGINPGFRLSEMVMPPKLQELENHLLKYIENSEILLILDKKIFFSTIKDINYFYNRKLITENEREELKKELLDILSYMENIMATGVFGSGTKISFYLSDVSLDGSYVYIESDNFECSLQWAYFVDALNFYNPTICQIQKNWIESLKRYSTLITQTGEMQRMDFIGKQKEIIDTFI